jgi:sugar fermentation stimulation protein A
MVLKREVFLPGGMPMRLPENLVRGVLIRRYKRFLADVRLEDGRLVTAHCPNSGSMQGCDIPGRQVLLSPAKNPDRKTLYTWELIHLPTTWVGINTLTANRLVEEAAKQRRIAELGHFDNLTREVKLGHSRIDFCLVQGDEVLYLEVKNVTLVENGTAFFPDAVTARGRKHLHALIGAVQEGHRSALFFVIQRGDAKRFAPAVHIDPAYSSTLSRARQAGVSVIAYSTRVDPTEIYLDGPLPVVL